MSAYMEPKQRGRGEGGNEEGKDKRRMKGIYNKPSVAKLYTAKDQNNGEEVKEGMR